MSKRENTHEGKIAATGYGKSTNRFQFILAFLIKLMKIVPNA